MQLARLLMSKNNSITHFPRESWWWKKTRLRAKLCSLAFSPPGCTKASPGYLGLGVHSTPFTRPFVELLSCNPLSADFKFLANRGLLFLEKKKKKPPRLLFLGLSSQWAVFLKTIQSFCCCWRCTAAPLQKQHSPVYACTREIKLSESHLKGRENLRWSISILIFQCLFNSRERDVRSRTCALFYL